MRRVPDEGALTAKRLFDLALAVPGTLTLLPVFAVVAVWIRLDSSGPALFRQVRVGRGGREFRIFKFRTMVTDAERRGGQLTVGADARITRVGRFLRRHKLDELPQLFNVIRGEMSLVGPRPEVPRYVDLYTAEQRRVLDLVPGITDLASIKYYDENAVLAAASDPERAYVDEIMPEKIRINLDYARRATVWTDLRVILGTAFRVSSVARD
jgi:lipopolysaccharide/colanic/teichoic acid biosynthesis glycosyltransferase